MKRTLLLLLMLTGTLTSAAERRPNFLFIYTDDQRWDAMGVVQREQGQRARFPWCKSPSMDRLAAEGVRFRNAFVTLSLCAPSRAAFLTGRYNHLNGITDNGTSFPETSVTHATLLRAAGYRTAYIGKWHMGNQRSLYEESLRVPMLARYPRLFGKGLVVDEMVLNVDLAPTFLDLAGVTVPPAMQGASWKELAAGRKPSNWRRSFFAEYYKELGDVPTSYAMRTTTHKLVKYPNRPEWTEVFDLVADPYEIKNLAADSALMAKLGAELNSLMKTVNYTMPTNANRPREVAHPPAKTSPEK